MTPTKLAAIAVGGTFVALAAALPALMGTPAGMILTSAGSMLIGWALPELGKKKDGAA
jgi:hypothetical protein